LALGSQVALGGLLGFGLAAGFGLALGGLLLIPRKTTTYSGVKATTCSMA
jgi:hypothetical protein